VIQFQVNGKAVSSDSPDDTPLLWVIRDELKLKGTKFGCGIAQCGACTVHMDGAPLRACVTPISAIAGKSITTIEGIAQGGELHPIQRQFLEHAALQCGICTPGLIVATKALLDKDPNPDEQTIRYWIAGNLCRCTGYDKIVRAIQAAAQELAHPA